MTYGSWRSKHVRRNTVQVQFLGCTSQTWSAHGSVWLLAALGDSAGQYRTCPSQQMQWWGPRHWVWHSFAALLTDREMSASANSSLPSMEDIFHASVGLLRGLWAKTLPVFLSVCLFKGVFIVNDLERQKCLFLLKERTGVFTVQADRGDVSLWDQVGLLVTYYKRLSFPKLGFPKPWCKCPDRAVCGRWGLPP